MTKVVKKKYLWLTHRLKVIFKKEKSVENSIKLFDYCMKKDD